MRESRSSGSAEGLWATMIPTQTPGNCYSPLWRALAVPLKRIMHLIYCLNYQRRRKHFNDEAVSIGIKRDAKPALHESKAAHPSGPETQSARIATRAKARSWSADVAGAMI